MRWMELKLKSTGPIADFVEAALRDKPGLERPATLSLMKIHGTKALQIDASQAHTPGREDMSVLFPTLLALTDAARGPLGKEFGIVGSFQHKSVNFGGAPTENFAIVMEMNSGKTQLGSPDLMGVIEHYDHTTNAGQTVVGHTLTADSPSITAALYGDYDTTNLRQVGNLKLLTLTQ